MLAAVSTERRGKVETAIEEAEMTPSYLLAAFALGTAVLAVWSFVRWPALAPTTFKAAGLRVLVAILVLQVGGGILDPSIGAARSFAALVVVGIVVPVLTFAFLASLWFMKLCAEQMRGAM
jgi:hypothetical protein